MAETSIPALPGVTAPSPLPPPTQSARLFVFIEPMLAIIIVFLSALAAIVGCGYQWWPPVVAAVIIVGGIVLGMSLWMVLMMYRVITYIIGFMHMAELLEATRILLASLFNPASGRPQ